MKNMETFIDPATKIEYYALALNHETGNWDAANTLASEHGDGWRLPTIDELELIFHQLHIEGKGGFMHTIYWASSEFSSEAAWYFDFGKGIDGTALKILGAGIIAIRQVLVNLNSTRHEK